MDSFGCGLNIYSRFELFIEFFLSTKITLFLNSFHKVFTSCERFILRKKWYSGVMADENHLLDNDS